MKKLYRIYYTTYDDNIHNLVVEELRKRFSPHVLVHKSRVHPEFRFIEVLTEDEGREEEIRDIVKNLAGTMYVRVDWISL